MEIRLLTIRLHLEGCQSLKEKRQRIAGVKKRLGRESFIAIMESGCQDMHQSAELSITIMADYPAQGAQRGAFVENELIQSVDARIADIASEVIW